TATPQSCTSSTLTQSPRPLTYLSFFFHHTPTSQLYTLSLHDALPISSHLPGGDERSFAKDAREKRVASTPGKTAVWGVDHTEESKISRYDVRRRLARGKMKNSSAAPSRRENPGTRANARSYPSALNKKPQVLSSQTVYAGKVFGIRRDEVIEPSGVRTTRSEE